MFLLVTALCYSPCYSQKYCSKKTSRTMMIFQSQENPCQKNVKGKNVDYTVLYSKWYRNQELS